MAVEESAVAVGHLDKTSPLAHGADEGALELSAVHGQGFGQGGDLFVLDPHVARIARATPAAAEALEPKPLEIPWYLWH
jgi:hypothetical protein